MSRFTVVAVAVLAFVLLPMSARATSLPALDVRLFPSGPSMQLDDGGVLSFIPKGSFSSDPWEWPIVAGQFAASAAINVGSVFLFNFLADGGGDQSVEDVRKSLLLWGLVQFATTPMLSATAVWGVGNASSVYSVAFGWPLAVNYVVELLLTAAKIGVGYGLVEVPKGEVVAGVNKLLGPFLIADFILHGILVPASVVYFSVRSRDAKGYNFGSRDVPFPAYALARPDAHPVAGRRERLERRQGTASLSVPFWAMAF